MRLLYSLVAILFLTSCEYINSQLDKSVKKDTAVTIKDTTTTLAPPTAKNDDETVINVEPTQLRPELFLAMKDWANDENEAHEKQKVMLSNLNFILFKNKLTAVAPPVSWHSRGSNQFFVEAGVPLEKRLSYNEPGTYYKQIKRSKAVVVHYFGKRSQLSRAYDSLNAWLAQNHQIAVGNPWEEYVSDPKVMKEVEFLQTDIYVETK